MANDQVLLMEHLTSEKFHLVGHDRGGRVGHRMALDHPDRIKKITLMDIVPTHLLLNELTQKMARSYYHWFFLSQPYPFPETLIGYNPDQYFMSNLTGLGASGLDLFSKDQLNSYKKAWNNPDTIRGMCNDYRAAIDIDFFLDEADLGRKLAIPANIMWGGKGIVGANYYPPECWQEWFDNIQSTMMPGGHFFPEHYPKETINCLLGFHT